MNNIVKTALTNSSITALYIVAVSFFLYWGGSNKIGKLDNNFFLIPIAFLMLFVFSAAFTSYFVFGKSALMYLDGKKKEAISIITYTLGFLFIYTLIALSILILSSGKF
jgi:hypothetical protein